MKLYLLWILITSRAVLNLPSTTSSRLPAPAPTQSSAAIPPNSTPRTTREKKELTLPYRYQIRQVYAPSPHGRPLDTDVANVTRADLIAVLIPVHRVVPVHELTVIPLGVSENMYRTSGDGDRYRNPLGGYGIGWRFGGHGGGHGFHYAYG